MSKDGPVLGMVPTGSTYAGGLVAKLCLTFCDPMDFSSPGSSVHGFPRQEYWSGLLVPSPRCLLMKNCAFTFESDFKPTFSTALAQALDMFRDQ